MAPEVETESETKRQALASKKTHLLPDQLFSNPLVKGDKNKKKIGATGVNLESPSPRKPPKKRKVDPSFVSHHGNNIDLHPSLQKLVKVWDEKPPEKWDPSCCSPVEECSNESRSRPMVAVKRTSLARTRLVPSNQSESGTNLHHKVDFFWMSLLVNPHNEKPTNATKGRGGQKLGDRAVLPNQGTNAPSVRFSPPAEKSRSHRSFSSAPGSSRREAYSTQGRKSVQVANVRAGYGHDHWRLGNQTRNVHLQAFAPITRYSAHPSFDPRCRQPNQGQQHSQAERAGISNPQNYCSQPSMAPLWSCQTPYWHTESQRLRPMPTTSEVHRNQVAMARDQDTCHPKKGQVASLHKRTVIVSPPRKENVRPSPKQQMVLSPSEVRKWESMFERLKYYKQNFGNCNVPMNFPDDPELGEWVAWLRSQRNEMIHRSFGAQRSKSKGRKSALLKPTPGYELTDERRSRLDAMGFCWYEYVPKA